MFMGLLGRLGFYAIIAALIISAIAGLLYTWHYAPLAALGDEIESYQMVIEQQDLSIKNLKTKVQNGKEELKKCEMDAQVNVFETEFNTEASGLDNLYRSYLDYKEDANESIEINASNKPTYRFIF